MTKENRALVKRSRDMGLDERSGWSSTRDSDHPDGVPLFEFARGRRHRLGRHPT